MSRNLQGIISAHRRGVKITKAELWELKYEFEKAITATVNAHISTFAMGRLDPWRKVALIAIDQLEEEAYARGLEEGRKAP